MADNTSTSHADMIQAMMTDRAIVSFANMTQAALPLVATNLSRFLPSGKVLNMPVQVRVTGGNHTEGTADTALQWSAATRTLTINVNKSVPFDITAELATWNTVPVLDGILMQILPWFIQNIDTSLGALYTGATHVVSGVTSAYITEAQIAEAKRKLDAAACPLAGRWLCVDSKNMEALGKITRFTEMQTSGNSGGIIEGVVGRIKGFDVVVSDQLTAGSGKRHCLAGVRAPSAEAWAQSSIGWAGTVPAPSNAVVREFELAVAGARLTVSRNTLAAKDEWLGHQLYGVQVIRPEWLVDIETAD